MNKTEANKLFENLFVLEVANNHWGDLKRGKKIISEFGKVVRYNNVKAALKLQFRDVPNFIHKDFQGRGDLRYIWKTEKTQLKKEEHAILINAIRKSGCIPMATAFDERAVEWCVELGIDIIKVASSDINDWFLLQKIARTKKPVILSTGMCTEEQIEAAIQILDNVEIVLACTSTYPTVPEEVNLKPIVPAFQDVFINAVEQGVSKMDFKSVPDDMSGVMY